MAFHRTLSRYLPVLSVFIRFFFFGGVMKANGVILGYQIRALNSTNTAVAWAFTLQCSVAYLTAPISSFLLRYLSCRQLGVIGGFLTGIGYVLSGIYLTSIWQLYVYHTISGIGFSIWSISQCLYINAHYLRSYASIFAIASGFIYLGVAILPLTLQWLIDQYGHGGGKACFGALLWNCMIGGVLLRTTPKSGRLLEIFKVKTIDESEKHFVDKYLLWFSSVFSHRKFGVMITFAMFAVYVFSSWAIFLVTLGESRGLSTQDAVFLSTMGGIGGVVGSVTGKALFHVDRMNAYTCCLLPSLVVGVTLLLSTYSGNFLILCALTFVTGLAQGVQYAGMMGLIPLLVCGHHLQGAYSTSSVTEGIVYQLGGSISAATMRNVVDLIDFNRVVSYLVQTGRLTEYDLCSIQDYYGSPEMVFVVCAIVSLSVAPLSLVWILDQPSIRQCYAKEEKDGYEKSEEK